MNSVDQSGIVAEQDPKQQDNYYNLLIDESVWVKLNGFSDVTQLRGRYCYIALTGGPLCENTSVCEWSCALQKDLEKETLAGFIKRHQQIGDLENWLYASQDPKNILAMQSYMACCFVNNGVNNCMDLSCTHEVGDVHDIQKIIRY